jgi:predicted nucleic acid-binding Zn ribbon protein
MGTHEFCDFCGAEIDFGQEFFFLVEVQQFEERVAPLEFLDRLPRNIGEPFRLCKECRASIEENQRDIAAEGAAAKASARRFLQILSFGGVAFLLLLVFFLVMDLMR